MGACFARARIVSYSWKLKSSIRRFPMLFEIYTGVYSNKKGLSKNHFKHYSIFKKKEYFLDEQKNICNFLYFNIDP